MTKPLTTGQPAVPGTDGGPGIVPSQENFLQGLLASKFLSKPEHEQQGRPSRVPHDDSRFSPSGQDKAQDKDSLTQRIKDGVKRGVHGLMEFFNKVGEELLRGAEAMARMTDRLKSKVEHQAARIAKVLEELTGLFDAGKTEKAERLQDPVDHRIDRLEHTVKNVSSRITEVADFLTGRLDHMTGSSLNKGSSTESRESTGQEEQGNTREDNAQIPQEKDKETSTS